MTQPTHSELHRRHLDGVRRIEEHVATAWAEYLAMTRASVTGSYEQTEQFAWRRLRKGLAALAHERRRVEFEFERALADTLGTRRAA